MTATLTLPLVDGVKVVVPDSLNLITPYVLQEQQDWFEDEIKFLRRLLLPGQKVIDIGANYGVYTLSMARAVGAGGHVWCFEPASATAALLSRSIAANGFGHVTLEMSALSSHPGTARLTLNDNAELNEIVRGDAVGGKVETVPLTTLDECLDRFGWRDIEVMKIDAEGEESNILKGGSRFFAELSPLVEYEVKAGNEMHLGLVEQFAALGYRSYRLVPGLQLLTPFSASDRPDGYLLNLFCCKQDCAVRLAARGFLVDPAIAPGAEGEALAALAARPAYHWRQALGKLPYGAALAANWEKTMAGGRNPTLEQALALHALAHDAEQPPVTRFNALAASLDKLQTLCATNAGSLRLASLGRVSLEFGQRGPGVRALVHLANTITRQNRLEAAEPFLAPGTRFDTLPPGDALANWALGGILEEVERQSAFSSFYTGQSSRQRLEIINSLGFASPEMQCRLQLVRKRFG